MDYKYNFLFLAGMVVQNDYKFPPDTLRILFVEGGITSSLLLCPVPVSNIISSNIMTDHS